MCTHCTRRDLPEISRRVTTRPRTFGLRSGWVNAPTHDVTHYPPVGTRAITLRRTPLQGATPARPCGQEGGHACDCARLSAWKFSICVTARTPTVSTVVPPTSSATRFREGRIVLVAALLDRFRRIYGPEVTEELHVVHLSSSEEAALLASVRGRPVRPRRGRRTGRAWSRSDSTRLYDSVRRAGFVSRRLPRRALTRVRRECSSIARSASSQPRPSRGHDTQVVGKRRLLLVSLQQSSVESVSVEAAVVGVALLVLRDGPSRSDHPRVLVEIRLRPDVPPRGSTWWMTCRTRNDGVGRPSICPACHDCSCRDPPASALVRVRSASSVDCATSRRCRPPHPPLTTWAKRPGSAPGTSDGTTRSSALPGS